MTQFQLPESPNNDDRIRRLEQMVCILSDVLAKNCPIHAEHLIVGAINDQLESEGYHPATVTKVDMTLTVDERWAK